MSQKPKSQSINKNCDIFADIKKKTQKNKKKTKKFHRKNRKWEHQKENKKKKF